MTTVYTSRVAYSGIDKLNTTVKSGVGLGRILAPTWDLVAGHKLYVAQQQNDPQKLQRWCLKPSTGEPILPLSQAEYTQQYLELLRQRFKADRQPFLDILAQECVTLTCYCDGPFCHRFLAVDVLEKIARYHALPFERGGEIQVQAVQQS
jgi:hypothetical protein